MAEAILPGTYITVRDEGLIAAGSVASGNIGIVGTANKGPVNEVKILGSLSEAKEIFGESDEWQNDQSELTLVRSLELIYNNGGQTVYAVRTADTLRASAGHTVKSKNTSVLLEAQTPGTWGNSIKIKVAKPENGKQRVEINYSAGKREILRETYEITGLNDFVEKVRTDSRLLKISEKSTPASTTGTGQLNPSSDNSQFIEETEAEGVAFSGGNDGANANSDDYQTTLDLLQNSIVNIVLLAGQHAQDQAMVTVLEGHLKAMEQNKRERIGLIGSGINENLDTIANHSFMSGRLIYTAPGILAPSKKDRSKFDRLHGGYLAAAVAGLIASLPVQSSPTNKTLTLSGLSSELTNGQLERLVSSRVLAVQKRDGYRVVKGITTDNGAWKQITTRRIVDYAIYGVRSACDPYIGKLNNERVRGAMKATLDAFLTRMVNEEALVGYSLSVTATRAQEIAGETIVSMTLQPTFSIDYIKVTMYLG